MFACLISLHVSSSGLARTLFSSLSVAGIRITLQIRSEFLSYYLVPSSSRRHVMNLALWPVYVAINRCIEKDFGVADQASLPICDPYVSL